MAMISGSITLLYERVPPHKQGTCTKKVF